MQPNELLRELLGRITRTENAGPRTAREPRTHVIILDGTMSTLAPGEETNAGLTYKLLTEIAGPARLVIRYEAGVQWTRWTQTRQVIEGRGINRQIKRTYGFLASRYRTGDRIFLFGYSRGAYAVRSLAGVIDRVGLVRSEHATVRTIRQAYRHYEAGRPGSAGVTDFTRAYCHEKAPVEMIGVWDTVKALGLRAPFFWRYADSKHEFHNHTLSAVVKRGYQALALDETREAYAPVMWETPPYWRGELEQMWFRGAHGDIGGQLSGVGAARGLSNIPLVWMLEKAEAAGLALPRGWRDRFPADPDAVSVGTMRGWGKFFIARRRRIVGADPSEAMHPTTGFTLTGRAPD